MSDEEYNLLREVERERNHGSLAWFRSPVRAVCYHLHCPKEHGEVRSVFAGKRMDFTFLPCPFCHSPSECVFMGLFTTARKLPINEQIVGEGPAAEQKRREECCKAADDLCQRCGVEVGLSEGQVHHKRKRSLGQDDRLSNLEWLCGNCHARHHHEGAGR